MTGRGAGYCAGFGYRNRFYATGVPGWSRFGGGMAAAYQNDPELEKQALGNQAEILQAELDAVKKRLEELNTKAQKK
jgi:hypothetical protein